METLYLLIPIALIVIVCALKILFWAINNGQYDDLDTESHRILFDDDDLNASTNHTSAKSSEDNVAK